MSSSYRVVTNIGEVDYEATACYAAFHHLVVDIQDHNTLGIGGMRYARFLRLFNVLSLPDKNIKIHKIYIRPKLGRKVPYGSWYNMYQVLSNFPATAPFIIKMSPKTIKKKQEIGIYLTKCPTHIAYFIMHFVRLFDELWCPYIHQVSKMFPLLGINNSMFLFVILQMCDCVEYKYMTNKDNYPLRLIYGDGFQFQGHTICPFTNGIPKEAINEIINQGTLNYFFKSAEKIGFDWAKSTFNDPLGTVKNISLFYSPPRKYFVDDEIKLYKLPSPWKRKEFLNYFNNIGV